MSTCLLMTSISEVQRFYLFFRVCVLISVRINLDCSWKITRGDHQTRSKFKVLRRVNAHRQRSNFSFLNSHTELQFVCLKFQFVSQNMKRALENM